MRLVVAHHFPNSGIKELFPNFCYILFLLCFVMLCASVANAACRRNVSVNRYIPLGAPNEHAPVNQNTDLIGQLIIAM